LIQSVAIPVCFFFGADFYNKYLENPVTTSISVQKNIPLAAYTTLKIGGEARFFVRAETERQVIEAFNFADENEFEIFILGGGSNVLISDKGFDGLVLQIALKGIETDNNLVTAQAGEDWDAFCALCARESRAGVECLSGIPGFVGGTPVQNVGAYGQEVSESIAKVRVFDRKLKEILELSNADCKFAYRTSIFNTTERNRFIVLAVTFDLQKNVEPKIVYKDLLQYFGNEKPTLKQTREAVLEIRRAKSMVIDELDANSKSAGSFFKNPVVSREQYNLLSENFAVQIPHFPVDEKTVKIPAAWLIEQSGFYKGFQKGNVGISSRHTLAIVNLGNGTANEVLELKDEIQKKVRERFDLLLAPEPIFVGF
jgi:UDP-N-acetylmuramate dehydrogenase